MTEAVSFEHALSLGLKAKMERVSGLIAPGELAAVAGVSEREVALFEANQYIKPIVKRKLLRAVELVQGTGENQPKTSPRMLFTPYF